MYLCIYLFIRLFIYACIFNINSAVRVCTAELHNFTSHLTLYIQRSSNRRHIILSVNSVKLQRIYPVYPVPLTISLYRVVPCITYYPQHPSNIFVLRVCVLLYLPVAKFGCALAIVLIMARSRPGHVDMTLYAQTIVD
jgi:hypothetical protein